MPLSSEVRRALSYLRKRYKVSEPDLVALAKKLQSGEEEESWEDITRKYLLNRRRQYARRRKA